MLSFSECIEVAGAVPRGVFPATHLSSAVALAVGARYRLNLRLGYFRQSSWAARRIHLWPVERLRKRVLLSPRYMWGESRRGWYYLQRPTLGFDAAGALPPDGL